MSEAIGANVGLWGAYGQGNFGDDLMAVGFSSYLRSEGFCVRSCSVDEKLAAQMGCDVESGLRTLLDWADAVVIGGGGLLSASTSGHDATYRAISRRFIGLIKLCGVTRTRLLLSSVGDVPTQEVLDALSHAADSLELLQPRIWPADGFASIVRLNERAILGSDVVPFLANSILGHSSNPESVWSGRIGVNLRWRDGKKLAARIARPKRPCVLMLTHRSRWHGKYEMAIPGYPTMRYQNVGDYLRQIASVDLVVSSKLHPGLAAMGVGVPFIPYRPRDKTLLTVRRFGLESLVCWRPEDVLQVAAELSDPGSDRSRLCASAAAEMVEAGRASMGVLSDRLRAPVFT